MATPRGKKVEREPPDGTEPTRRPDDSRGPIPDLVRRALAMGLSGFFVTEEAIRRAVGDTLPQDWIDFAVDQSDRTRAEFLERLSYEIGRTLDNVDVAAVLRELLEGRTLEVTAQIRLGAREGETTRAGVRILGESAKRSEGGDDA